MIKNAHVELADVLANAAKYTQSLGFTLIGKPGYAFPPSARVVDVDVKFSGSLLAQLAKVDRILNCRHTTETENGTYTWELENDVYISLTAKASGYTLRLERQE